MWRALTHLPSSLAALLTQLLLLRQEHRYQAELLEEQNLLIRDLIVKVTTQPSQIPMTSPLPRSAETSATLPSPSTPSSSRPLRPPPSTRIRTERDVTHLTRADIQAEQLRKAALDLHPHRERRETQASDVLPPPPPPIIPLP